jgi:ethanolamine permease
VHPLKNSAVVSTPRAVPGDYFARRGLRRFAGAWSIWALGVSVVIPGEFSGWNYGLITGGFGGLLVATLVVSVMYICLCFSLAEMSSAMPFAGGGYGFARCALGPWGGYVVGMAQTIEFSLSAAAVVVSVGDAANAVIGHSSGSELPEPLVWAAAYLLFTVINIYGIELTCRIALLLTVFALGVLAFFSLSAIPHFDIALALDVPVAAGGSRWLPNGMTGIAWAIPFAVWFLVDIEMLTLAAEEAEQPERHLPKGLLWGIATLIIGALLVLFLNSAVPPGAAAIGDSSQPLLTGFRGIFGDRINPVVFALFALLSYAAGFHAMIFAYGRSIFAQARAGYLPTVLSLTHKTRKTPHVALIAGAVFGYGAAVLIKLVPHELHVDAVLLNMAVFSAIVSYILQMLSFLVLRRKLPDMKRPFVSALGATGAMTALVVSVGAGILAFANGSYHFGMLACLLIFAIGAIYFRFYGRYHIVAAPEEVFAAEHRPMMVRGL